MQLESLQNLLLQRLEALVLWMQKDVLTLETALQAGILCICIVAAFFAAGRLRKALRPRLKELPDQDAFLIRLGLAVLRQAFPGFLFLFCLIALFITAESGFNYKLIKITSGLVGAWAVINFTASWVQSRFWARLVALFAWTAAALNILGLLAPALDILDTLGFSIGSVHLTVLSILKSGIILLLLIKLGTWLAGIAESRLLAVPDLTPSMRVLSTKFLKVAVVFIAVVVALNSIGVNLAALAVFGGAVGVGLGFGLQKVVSNLVSGIILLMDKSIKPNDVIQIGDIYGSIRSLNARFAAVKTRDGTEYLIPNEDLIVNQVINWSYSDKQVRLKADVGVSYNSDIRLALKLMVEAAEDTVRVLADPQPVGRLLGFGDSAVNLQLRFWIEDPENGVVNVTSEILMKIWDKLHANNIEIPFPQRDLHIKSGLDRPARMPLKTSSKDSPGNVSGNEAADSLPDVVKKTDSAHSNPEDASES